jgi:hypothetical protein
MELPTGQDLIDIVESQIQGEHYCHFQGTNATVCCIQMKNGHTFIGTAQAADMENFKLLVGKETARREAFDQALSAELYVQRSITRFVNSDT